MKTRSNKNDNTNNGGGDEQEQPQQLRRSARKRKLNQLANDGKPAAGGEEDQPGKEDCSSKNSRRDGKNDQDLEQIVQLPQVTGDGNKQIADENEEEAELPTRQQMKIQLSKETWFEMLEFVGRRQLGQIVPQVGDRRFAGIAQSFLHSYGRITLFSICISSPDHRLIPHPVAVPENVKNFRFISLSYLNTPIINLLQKFQQNSLLGNVNLDLHLHTSITGRGKMKNTKTLLKTLAHILPAIANINSIRGETITQLVYLCSANSEMVMAMLKMARFLEFFHSDSFEFEFEYLINHWLHTPRDDGKPRVLILPLDYYPIPMMNTIPHFIDITIKMEFATAKRPVCFFIRFFVFDTVEWHDNSMENEQTNEKLVFKKVATSESINRQQMALISRYPLAAGKRWIEANEREALGWDFDEQNDRICLGYPITNAIDSEDDNRPHRRREGLRPRPNYCRPGQ